MSQDSGSILFVVVDVRNLDPHQFLHVHHTLFSRPGADRQLRPSL